MTDEAQGARRPNEVQGARSPDEAQDAEPKDNSYWLNYVEYNKTLRAWFVSFGVGALVLLMANPTLLETLRTTHQAYCVVGCFVAGCSSQVVVAVLNKTISWHLAAGEDDPKFTKSRFYKCFKCLSGFYWIDFILDMFSLVAFAVGIFYLTGAILSDPPVVQSPPMPK